MTASAARNAACSLTRIIVFRTPSASATADVETTPAAWIGSVANSTEPRTVDATSPSGSLTIRPDEDRRHDATAGKALTQPLAGPGQPAPDRPHRAPGLPRRLLVGVPLQVAKDDYDPVPLRQAVDLAMQDLDRVVGRRALVHAARSSPARRSICRRRFASRRAWLAARSATR